MTSAQDIVAAYDRLASRLAGSYETVSADDVLAPFVPFIRRGPGLALDIGAGTGRDAAWLASCGYDTVAVEPSAGMRAEACRLRPDVPVRWVDDTLPDLRAVQRLGLSFDLVLLSAVWMHVAPDERPRAFRKIAALLKPGGLLLMTLRNGPGDPERRMWPAPLGEIEALAQDHGLSVVRVSQEADCLGRSDVRWTSVCLRMPDDGSGSLALLRGIILNDSKSSTYKLALLRAVARVADTASGLVSEAPGEDAVEVPLGAVALHWLQAYLPLLTARLPQAPGNDGLHRLGFCGPGFRSLHPLGVMASDIRIGAVFSGERADAVATALREARDTIARMPAHHTRYPNGGGQVFVPRLSRIAPAKGELVLDAATLGSMGSLRVPGHLWRSLQRLSAWVEPVLVAEWARLVRGYGERMGRPVAPGEVESALTWQDPVRDTGLAKLAARRITRSGRPLACVWSGDVVPMSALDIDHCLPWSAWPCGDLWNLLPASRRVNQRQKRDRLPSARALAEARSRVVAWWQDAWLADSGLQARFRREASAALPLAGAATAEEVFSGLEWRRLRLAQDQQVPEWNGLRGGADSPNSVS
ncbi:methyltransferase domain-containing protein [Arenibaculum pallidiluteum]|uniref:methyltransferase domain-containing protein n=1 Tax=Arenibaculum pallidiluteum TaxID=2812559 RepID=UPI001A9676FF|nr:class I SAM-dependent methyltransferase [Arenibaculum pallidiluteum]